MDCRSRLVACEVPVDRCGAVGQFQGKAETSLSVSAMGWCASRAKVSQPMQFPPGCSPTLTGHSSRAPSNCMRPPPELQQEAGSWSAVVRGCLRMAHQDCCLELCLNRHPPLQCLRLQLNTSEVADGTTHGLVSSAWSNQTECNASPVCSLANRICARFSNNVTNVVYFSMLSNGVRVSL